MKNFRFLSIIMAIVLTFSCINCFASTDATTEEVYKGDIDLDGNINASDALLALKHAAKITEVNTLIADVDEDTSVNASDALLILKYAAKLITEFPGGNTIGGITPAPTETVSPGPSETTSPVPTETISPTPSETTSPAPSETTSPAPSETTSPVPSETTSPAPSETISPTPSETISPVPSETTSPAPTEVATPEPTPTVTPEPTATPTPIQQVKAHIQENGHKEEDGSFTIGYSYEDGTVISSINYNVASDTMVFNLLYYDVTDEDETMSVEISMDYDSTFDDADLTVTYSNADYTQIYQAKTQLNPETITSESEYAFEETHSENCSSAEKEAILSLADMYMETALYLWNDILQTDPGISLSDLGFTNYSAQ